MKKNIKIAISGKSGCGNTTISKLVADELDLKFINFTFRSLAEEHGIDMEKVIELAAKDDSWDKEVDNRQLQLAKESEGCVLGSRLAIWIFKEADLKVYLYAKPETRVKRIMKREGGNFDSVSEYTTFRDKQDHERYLRIYNIDNDDYEFADIKIDTDSLNQNEIADIIIKKINIKY